MKVKCIAIDDEPRALEIIEEYIAKTPFLELLKTFRNPLKAFEYIREQNVELIFLDINMPNLTGIQFIKSLSVKPQIILTTAYSEYAVESYGLDVLDYLLKPIEFDRFLKAVNKVIERTHGNSSSEITETVKKEDGNYVFIKEGNQLIKVNTDDILYIEGAGNYQSIQLSAKKILTLIKMDELLSLINNVQFVRVHKSFIVNLSKINSIENHRIKIGDKRIPVSETYRNSFYKRTK